MSLAKVLIVEDEFIIAQRLKEQLRKYEYEVIDIVASGENAIVISEEKCPDIVLMDIVLQGKMTGLDAAKVILNNLGIPVVYLTALHDQNTLSKAQKIGGYGFIPKPYNINQVDSAIQIAMGQHKKSSEIWHQATHDSLTGITNRVSFFSYAEDKFHLSQRVGFQFVVLMFDIDYFKKINDSFGHTTGDYILKMFSELVFQNLRYTDIFARIGGEEFAVLLQHTTLERAILLAEKIQKKVEETIFFADNQEINITVSIGLSCLEKNDKMFTDILKRADKALYNAKENGRNCVEYIYNQKKSKKITRIS